MLYIHTVPMLVDVYRLRSKGVRLSSSELRDTTPTRGTICVTREPGGRLGQWARTAYLMSLTSDDVLLRLHQIQLQRWDSTGIIIAGTEREWHRSRCTAEYRQSWYIVFPAGFLLSATLPQRAAAGEALIPSRAGIPTVEA